MHDPLVVAHEIRSPFPKVERRNTPARHQGPRWSAFWHFGHTALYFPPVITVWHREPHDRDAFEVCPRDGDWKWHVRHWKIQLHPVQKWRRRIMTRCAYCGGRSTKKNPANISHQWDRPEVPWWYPEPGLYHHGCSAKYGRRNKELFLQEKNAKEWDQWRAAIAALRGVLKEIERGPGNHLAVLTLMSRIQDLTEQLKASQEAAREASKKRRTQ